MSPPPPPTPITFPSLLPMTKTKSTPSSSSSNSHSNSSTYTTTFTDEFCIGTVPNGGYITSAFLLVAKTHMQQTHPSLPCPDPINLHLQFLRRTAVGPATFVVTDTKLGRRISNLHIVLRQHADPLHAASPDEPMQDEVQGYIVLTNLETETGPSQNTKYELLPRPVPVDLERLASNTDENYIRRRPDPYGVFRRATMNSQIHLVRPSHRPTDHSPAIADQWVRFTPMDRSQSTGSLAADLKSGRVVYGAGRWTNDALGYLVDIFPQLNERFINGAIEDALLVDESEVSESEIMEMVKRSRKQNPADSGGDGNGEDEDEDAPPRIYWYPTLLLNLDVKRKLPEDGVEWLFVRVQAKRIHLGRFDLHVEVWGDGLGEDGGLGLVATSSHASLVLDAGRNMNRKGKGHGKGERKEKGMGKKKGKKERESKI